MRFHNTPLHKRREPSPLSYMTQRSSFWIATFSLTAFICGNMVGQHGWYAFWASVLGKEEHIVYTGTVSPIEKVPNYVAWAQYGGDPHSHTYRQVPSSVLVDLPPYSPSQQNRGNTSSIGQIYSVGHKGSYKHGGDGDGAHPGVDIRVPVGTPIRSIANGIVHRVGNDAGFGKFIVIKHVNVPDPAAPGRTTTLYSSYAHLSAQYKKEGDIALKGENIGLSGQTGYASGPHLHFQLDLDTAPWHPYWPFSTADLNSAGLSMYEAVNSGLHAHRVDEHTVNPMLYVQADYAPTTLVADARPSAPTVGVITPSVSRTAPTTRTRVSLKQRAAERALQRLAARRYSVATQTVRSYSSSSAAPMRPVTTVSTTPVTSVVQRTEVASNVVTRPVVNEPENVTQIGFRHDGSFNGREWEVITVTLENDRGYTVKNPIIGKDIYLRTAYGEAQFDPPRLRMKDFVNGSMNVRMLPFGRRTVVIQAQPQQSVSKPMVYSRVR